MTDGIGGATGKGAAAIGIDGVGSGVEMSTGAGVSSRSSAEDASVLRIVVAWRGLDRLSTGIRGGVSSAGSAIGTVAIGGASAGAGSDDARAAGIAAIGPAAGVGVGEAMAGGSASIVGAVGSTTATGIVAAPSAMVAAGGTATNGAAGAGISACTWNSVGINDDGSDDDVGIGMAPGVTTAAVVVPAGFSDPNACANSPVVAASPAMMPAIPDAADPAIGAPAMAEQANGVAIIGISGTAALPSLQAL